MNSTGDGVTASFNLNAGNNSENNTGVTGEKIVNTNQNTSQHNQNNNQNHNDDHILRSYIISREVDGKSLSLDAELASLQKKYGFAIDVENYSFTGV